MIKLKKWRAGTLLLAFLLLATAGCSSKEKTDDKTVRVAFFSNITHSQALIGKDNGAFQKALGDEIKVKWKQFNAGPAEIEAMLAGEVDIGYIGPGPAINGYAKSKGELKIIAGVMDAGAILVSKKGLEIKDMKELSGKRVAIPQYGNTQDLTLRNILKENGLKDKTKGGTVEILQADNSDIKTLLAKGDIDAALVPEPWGARLVKEVQANVVLDFNQVWRQGNYPTTVIIARTEFLEKHPDLVEKFLKTHVDLTDYTKSNVSEAKKIVNKQIGELIKKPLAEDVLDKAFTRLSPAYDPGKQAINEMVDISIEASFLKSKPDMDNLFDTKILNKILKEKGYKEIQ